MPASMTPSRPAGRRSGYGSITTTIIGLIPPVQTSHRPAESTNV